jgi:alkylation response protein AidB-like acyl-CoA dehydrogenase
MEITTDAVRLLGGYGYIEEFPVERMMRDAKITHIYKGQPAEIRTPLLDSGGGGKAPT